MAIVIKHPKTGNVLLENTVKGKVIRLSTGKKADSRLMGWYKAHAEDEFWKLYYQKYSNDSLMRFSEYANYIIGITKSNRNEFSQRAEVGKVKRLVEYFGDVSISSILPSKIQQWQEAYLTKYASKTVREYRCTLNGVFEFAVNDEIIRRNPMKSVKAPRKVRLVVETFSEKERKQLIEKSEGQLHNIIQFAFFSGLRAGEITGLKWCNIDFEENKINVCNRMRSGKEDLPKGGKVRVIDLLPQAKQALISQRQKTGLSKYVFHSKEGLPYYSEVCITMSIKVLCKRIGIKEGGLQVMRRSHNTMLKQCGLPIDWILHQMGHEKDEVNRDHYTGQITVDVSKIIA